MEPGHYVGPVILATDEDASKKVRKVEIIKSEVNKDIDLFTHKHVDAKQDLGLQAGSAISSDNAEKVDGAVIARYVMFRDSQLRVLMQKYLVDMEQERANDNLILGQQVFTYWLRVPDEFNDNTLRPLAEYMHRFIVWGALYDWYSQFGMNQAAVYGTELERIQDQIFSIMRGPSIVKRPMQPFGPAEKMED